MKFTVVVIGLKRAWGFQVDTVDESRTLDPGGGQGATIKVC